MNDGPGGTIVRGAVAGTAGTVTMSSVMLAAQRAGLMGRQPPEKVTEHTLAAAGARPASDSAENALSTVAHFAFGAAAGSAFAVSHRVVGRSVPASVAGPAFGLGVWALAYKGVIPRLGLMPRPEDDRPGRPAAMVAAHLVWGLTTGWLVGRRGRQ